MHLPICRFLILCACFFAFSWMAAAQTPDANSADGKSGVLSKEDLPKGIQETLAKKRIQTEEKEYQELIAKVEEADSLSNQISASIQKGGKLSGEDLKKLDRLEKLINKIRGSLGAKDDNSDDETTDSFSPEDNKSIQELSGDLLTEIKKIGRHTISVIAVESTNSLLKLIRSLKFNKN